MQINQVKCLFNSSYRLIHFQHLLIQYFICLYDTRERSIVDTHSHTRTQVVFLYNCALASVSYFSISQLICSGHGDYTFLQRIRIRILLLQKVWCVNHSDLFSCFQSKFLALLFGLLSCSLFSLSLSTLQHYIYLIFPNDIQQYGQHIIFFQSLSFATVCCVKHDNAFCINVYEQ